MSTADYGARLSGVEAESRELRRSVDVLFGKVDSQSGKLDAMATTLHEIRGAAGPSMKDMVIIVTALAGLFASVAGGILWLARGGNSDELHKLELRIQRLETVISIAKVTRAPSGTAWVPEAVGR